MALSISAPLPSTSSSPPTIASGEKAKARDILAAIRTLQAIEQEQRPATPEERQTLARFGGFGPVALSIFPDPVTGRYKDAGWQALGDELKSLLTPEEYDSAKRTTFNAFYTSPTVIAAMHDGARPPRRARNATVLEPGCGTGNFMAHAPAGHAVHRRRAGFASPAASPGPCIPTADIRIENFRDTKLPDRLDAVIGNVPFADVKLDYRGQKLSLHDFFFAKSLDALKPGGVLALVTSHFTLDKQNAAIREYLADQADFLGAIRLPSDAFKREGTASSPTSCSCASARPASRPATPTRTGCETAPLAIEGAGSRDQPLFPEPPGDGAGHLEPQGHALRRRRLQRHRQRRPGRAAPTTPSDRLPEGSAVHVRGRTAEPPPRPPSRPPPPERHIAEGSFFVGDDRIIRQVEGGAGRAGRSTAARSSRPTAR